VPAREIGNRGGLPLLIIGANVIMTNSLQPYNFSLPIGSLDAYIQSVQKIPLLTEEEEKTLALSWHHSEDLEAAKKMVMSHLRYVVSIARRYLGYGLPLADLIQEGNIGLMKAVKKFNPMMNVRLVSFAVYWIKAEIHEYVLKNWRIVKIATTKAHRKLFFKLKSYKQKFGENLNLISKESGIKKSTVEEMNARLNHYDANIEEAYEIADHYADPAKLIEADDKKDHKEKLLTALKTLDIRSQDILTKRWLNNDKSTLEELAAHYNVSAERIRQLEKNAMGKMRAVLAEA
jgi:RNA polymerase sigma-32 factor